MSSPKGDAEIEIYAALIVGILIAGFAAIIATQVFPPW